MSSEPDSGSDALTQQKMPRRQFLVGAGTAAAAVATGAGVGAADDSNAVEHGHTRDGLNWASDFVQNSYFGEEILTRTKHKMAWGTDDDALTTYENDSGEKATLAGYVPREDTENVLTVRADKFQFADASAFPRGRQFDKDGDGEDDSDVSALAATHWATTGATNGSVSVSDADLDVSNALTVTTSGVASGETVTAEFTDVSIGSDAEKRFIQLVANVDQLTSGATVEIVVIDDDGDEKIVTASPSADLAQDSVFATATGKGIVLQQRLGDLATDGSGDGNFDSIERVEVRVSGADAEITLTAFNAAKMERWSFGDYLQNEGTDDEEQVTRYEPGPGTFTIMGFDTLSDPLTGDDAVVYDVEQPMRYTLEASTLPYEWELVNADAYPGFDYRLIQRGKFEVPTGYDLSHTGLTLTDQVDVPGNRYDAVRTTSGVDGVAFEDIEDTSWDGHATEYSGEGGTVELSGTVQPGVVYGYEAEILMTESEWNNDAAGSNAPSGDGNDTGVVYSNGGGGGNGIVTMAMGIVSTVLGFFGLRRVIG